MSWLSIDNLKLFLVIAVVAGIVWGLSAWTDLDQYILAAIAAVLLVLVIVFRRPLTDW